jgi:hypothetical protein
MNTKPEETLQIAIVDYVRRCCPRVKIFASMNGMYLGRFGNSYTYIAKMKQMGMTPGEPDLRLHWEASDDGQPLTLFVECKIKPNKPTELQAECLADLTNMDFPAEVVHSFEEALAAFALHQVPTLDTKRSARF